MDDTVQNEEREFITLTDDNGEEVQCEFLDTVEYRGKLYCVLEPWVGTDEYEEGSCYIFHLTENKDGTVDLTPIENEEELNAVFAVFLENNSGGCGGDCSGCAGCGEKK